MLKSKNKGFVLMEAIVVIVVISLSLLSLFASYNKILSKLKEENKYDLSEYLYKTNYIRKYLRNCDIGDTPAYSLGGATGLSGVSDILVDYTTCYCKSSDSQKIGQTFSAFKVKRIYLVADINGTNTDTNLEKFDAYMIDYIRKLDVDDKSSLIIVEYGKTSMDMNYNPMKLYENDPTNSIDDINLEETYIASLEW